MTFSLSLLLFEGREQRVGRRGKKARENRGQWVAKHPNTKAFTSCSVFKRLNNNKHIQLHKTGEAEEEVCVCVRVCAKLRGYAHRSTQVTVCPSNIARSTLPINYRF